jgi:hypothetical protein
MHQLQIRAHWGRRIAYLFVKPFHCAMNIRYALILAVTTGLFLIGCASDEGTRNERHVEGLMRHRDWPRIQQIAEKEVKKREILWPAHADYVPIEHKDKVWSVTAMTGTRNGDVERMVILTIEDDGTVGAYKRYWKGKEIPDFP